MWIFITWSDLKVFFYHRSTAPLVLHLIRMRDFSFYNFTRRSLSASSPWASRNSIKKSREHERANIRVYLSVVESAGAELSRAARLLKMLRCGFIHPFLGIISDFGSLRILIANFGGRAALSATIVLRERGNLIYWSNYVDAKWARSANNSALSQALPAVKTISSCRLNVNPDCSWMKLANCWRCE